MKEGVVGSASKELSIDPIRKYFTFCTLESQVETVAH